MGGSPSAIFLFFVYLHVPNHKPEEEGRPSSQSVIIYLNYNLCWSGHSTSHNDGFGDKNFGTC